MIKVKNRSLDAEAIKTLNELIELDISAVAAFKLAKIVKELDSIVTIKNEREVALIKKYAKTDEEGNIIEGKNSEGQIIKGTFEIQEGKGDEYSKEMEELLNLENELAFEKISVEQLNLEKISAKKIMKVDFLFEI